MLWLKTAGVILIISGSGAWGLSGARRIRKRVEQLRELRIAIGFLEKEITCTYTPLSLALERTAKFCNRPVNLLFAESSDRLKNREGITAGEAWNIGLHKLHSNSALKETDIELLSAAAHQLGMSDVFEQEKFFRLIQEELKIYEDQALSEVESGQKLWSYGGFILGTLIVLLLI